MTSGFFVAIAGTLWAGDAGLGDHVVLETIFGSMLAGVGAATALAGALGLPWIDARWGDRPWCRFLQGIGAMSAMAMAGASALGVVYWLVVGVWILVQAPGYIPLLLFVLLVPVAITLVLWGAAWHAFHLSFRRRSIA